MKRLLFAGLALLAVSTARASVTVIDQITPQNNAFQFVVASTNVSVSTGGFTGNLATAGTNLQANLNAIDKLAITTGAYIANVGTSNNPVFSVASGTISGALSVGGNVIQGTNTVTLTISAGGLNAPTLVGLVPAASLANAVLNQTSFQTGAALNIATGTIGLLNATTANLGQVTANTMTSTATITQTLVVTNVSAGVAHFDNVGNSFTRQVSLSTEVTGNLPVANLNSGIGADSQHFWNGTGAWTIPSSTSAGAIQVNQNGSPVNLLSSTLNFVGGGLTVTAAGNATNISLNSSLPGGATSYIQNSGTSGAPSFTAGASTITGNFLVTGVITASNTVITTATGQIADAAIDSSSVTKMGAAFNGANQLAQVGAGGTLPDYLLDSSSVTKGGTLVAGTNISIIPGTGFTTINANVLVGIANQNYLQAGSTSYVQYSYVGSSQTVFGPSVATYFIGDGSLLTNVTATALPVGNTNYIQNTGSLQTGATFYVSSGTAVGTLTAGTFVGSGAKLTNIAIGLSTQTVGNYVATIAAAGPVTVTGSGSNSAAVTIGLTSISLSTGVTGSLPAASIAAGSLGASVLASSFPVNGVVAGSYSPANVTVNAQGLVISISTGSGGSAGGVSVFPATGTASFPYGETITTMSAPSGTAAITISTPMYVVSGSTSPNQFYNGIVVYGHIEVSSTTPAISSCGTGSPSAVGNDQFFTITMGAGTLTSCTATFAVPWTNTPICVMSSPTAIASPTVTSTVSTVVIGGTTLTSDVVSVMCGGYR